MNFSELLQRFLLFFLLIAIILPISSTFLFLFGMILMLMNLQGAATILGIMAFIMVLVWFVSLACLVLFLTIDRLMKKPHTENNDL